MVPHTQRRYENPVGLQKRVVDKMRNILKAENPPPTIDPANQSPSDRNRCYTCIEVICGKEDYKKLKISLAKVKTECEKCKKKVCKVHLFYVCKTCL